MDVPKISRRGQECQVFLLIRFFYKWRTFVLFSDSETRTTAAEWWSVAVENPSAHCLDWLAGNAFP